VRLSFYILLLLAGSVQAANWPAWRGPLGTGITEETNLPISWGTNQNVKWRSALPEPGNSTPIVWNERIFLTQPVGDRRTLRCLRRTDGQLFWERSVNASEKEPTHPTNPYCSSSPVTDGERVIAWFASDGLFCFDFQGKELWSRKDLGRVVHIWGSGSSPLLNGDICFLNFGPGETSYLVALDKKTGRTLWKHEEESGYGKGSDGQTASAEPKKNPPTFVGSWTTPVISRESGKGRLLMSWPGRLAAYEPVSGKEVWSCGGLNPLVYTSPIYGDGMVVGMGGFGGSAIAVRGGGTGDVTASRRLWQHPRSPQRIGSGVVYQDHIYIHNDPGTATCLKLGSGEKVWEERLPAKAATGQNWSSVLLSGDRCYTITQGGDCFVFRASPQFEVIAVNALGERSNSSIVPSNGELFIRTHQALWCINAPPGSGRAPR
jgi:outer membrane protein assembly factor BamB